MNEDPTEAKYRRAAMFDQDRLMSDGTYYEDYETVSDLDNLRAQSAYWRSMYHDELEHVARLTAPRKPDWIARGYIIIIQGIFMFLAFALGVMVGR